MAARRIVVDPTDPAGMTAEHRRAELASIVAAGVIRHFERRSFAPPAVPEIQPDSDEAGLEVPPEPRPYGPVVNAARERGREDERCH